MVFESAKPASPTVSASAVSASGSACHRWRTWTRDGLTNRQEVDIGSDPFDPNTDNDARTDGQEGTFDTDGDGLADAIESASVDTDQDCKSNEVDATNATYDPLPGDVEQFCPDDFQGVCAGAAPRLVCGFDNGQLVATGCEPDLASVIGFSAVELCDNGVDDNCDGQTDVGDGCGAVCGEQLANVDVVYVSKTFGTDLGGNGSGLYPLGSLQAGIDRAIADGKSEVWLTKDTYDGAILDHPNASITLRGGFQTCDFVADMGLVGDTIVGRRRWLRADGPRRRADRRRRGDLPRRL